jgi:drug/metabolite transporter (DMT)-like permease
MRIAAPEFGPLVLVEVRVVIAALFLLPIFLLRADISELTVHWKKLAILSVLNSAAPFFLLTYATLSITGGFAGILNATAPIFAAMVAWIWLSDRLGASQIVGLVIGFVGVLVLVWNKVTLAFDGTTVAILAGIVAAIFYAVGGNYTKKYMGQLNSLAIATGTMIAAAIILLPIAVYLWPSEPVSIRSWIAAIIMGIASTGIAYILYFRLIRNVGPAKAITVTYLIPAFAMFWGAIFIDEKVTPIMIVGCVIIFFGTALATGMLSFGRR